MKAILIGLVAGLVAGPLMTVTAWQRIDVSVKPYVQSAPGTVQVTTRIEPRPEHAMVLMMIDGPVEQISIRDLAGDKAPRQFVDVYKNLPEGEYLAISGVFDKNDKRIEHAVKKFEVR